MGLLVAQISDPHLNANGGRLYGVTDPAASLARVVAAVNRARPDLVLLTGDVTDDGTAAAAERAARCLARLRAPLFAVPGNHDGRDAIRRCLGRHSDDRSDDWCAYVEDSFPLRLIALDSTTEDPRTADLPADELDWLESRLAGPRPALVFLHHPPFDTGVAWMDEMAIADPARHRLGACLRTAGSVRAVIAGHLHRPMRGTWYGIPVLAAPSVMERLEFDGETGTGTPVLRAAAPPGFVLHRWDCRLGVLSSRMVFLDGHTESWMDSRPDPGLDAPPLAAAGE